MTTKVTLIPGDGIGPEVSAATQKVISASQAPLEWEIVEAGEACIAKYGTPLPDHVLETIRRNKVAIKGPITTPVGKGFRSVNVALRQQLQLFANVRHLRNLPNVPSRYQDVDIVVVRENTEDLYAGIEHMVGKDAAESIKIITREASERIGRYAFELARREGRKRVTIVHKANIMKLSDGLFLESIRGVAREFPGIECEDRIVDALCMNLVQIPEQLDVLVLPNLYGDIVSDLVAGLVGGLGVAPGANIGAMGAVFEAVHGSAPQIAGRNLANPIAMILSGVEMLKYLGFDQEARRVEQGIDHVLRHKEYLTPDLGGNSGTQEMAAAIVESMK
ncbi:isocitrate/isopropylmalate dehydrogenase family protein [Desulfosporosinus sp. PR]|uniref:isocitrate/isopropylmalate dehydrogenase family protein n=1 Tax=Candidatus Desulfosporosinus nitrosoreducens TaxID=3401928 RepID=UPI0027ECC4D6|nr:isocitrate/isopropylmalate dehydrogenase family protein [Desulfosporosinus sp. PR]MDQ7094417.1 isocitrate/isopropylmalate dehydrogenase family protein [Desulfosporosinus sp. PR]